MKSELATSCHPTRRQCLAAGAAFVSLGYSVQSLAQFRVEISGVGLKQYPIAIANFKGEEAAPQKISAIVRADLERSGQFKNIDTAGVTLDETSRPEMNAWKQKTADYLVAGSVSKLSDGRLDVRFKVWDTVRGQDLGGPSFAEAPGNMRLVAHRIADYIYEKITGDKSVFSTRIAYVTKTAQKFNLWVADADGEGGQPALTSSEPIISPSWSPSGAQLAYVSFESRKPVVYIQNLESRQRRKIADFKGSNSAPAWAPDGKTLALTLSRDGVSQIYGIDSNGGEPRRLSQSGSIDTEPVFSPDGKYIYFVSDRGGAPQIYRMPPGGESAGRAERVSFTGSYNISPSISPDGQQLAYISRVGGAFKLHVMSLQGGNALAITDTAADERPSFAPNSKLIVFATQQGGKEALMTTTLDGSIKARLGSQGGDIREPQWGPFQK